MMPRGLIPIGRPLPPCQMSISMPLSRQRKATAFGRPVPTSGGGCRPTWALTRNYGLCPWGSTVGLTLTFEDIRLPGNGGLNLVIQRTYNSKNTCNEWTVTPYGTSCSKNDENTWLGFGWTLHFGRLFKSNSENVFI